MFGCIQGKNDRESKYRNKKIAFFTLEDIHFQRKKCHSDMKAMLYVSLHDLIRNLVGTFMLNFHQILATKWRPQQQQSTAAEQSGRATPVTECDPMSFVYKILDSLGIKEYPAVEKNNVVG